MPGIEVTLTYITIALALEPEARKGQLSGKDFCVHKKRRVLNLIFSVKSETTPTNHGC